MFDAFSIGRIFSPYSFISDSFRSISYRFHMEFQVNSIIVSDHVSYLFHISFTSFILVSGQIFQSKFQVQFQRAWNPHRFQMVFQIKFQVQFQVWFQVMVWRINFRCQFHMWFQVSWGLRFTPYFKQPLAWTGDGSFYLAAIRCESGPQQNR